MKLVMLDEDKGAIVPATDVTQEGKILEVLQKVLIGHNANEEKKAEWPVTLCWISDDFQPMLEQVCNLAEQGEAVFMASFDSPNNWTHMANEWWHAATSFPRVRHQQLPHCNISGLDGMRNLARKAFESSNEGRWELPLRLARLGSVGSGALGALRHIQNRALADTSGPHYQKWRKGGEALFGTLVDTELTAAIENARSLTPFAGEHFPLVAVDCEGTALNADGSLNANALLIANERAYEYGLPLILWTGGSLEKIKRVLSDFRHDGSLPFLLAEKAAFRGASVEIALDDLPQEEFSRTYGIGVTHYVQV